MSVVLSMYWVPGQCGLATSIDVIMERIFVYNLLDVVFIGSLTAIEFSDPSRPFTIRY